MVWPITIGIIAAFMVVAFIVSMIVGQQQERRARAMSVIARTGGDSSGGNEATSKALAKQRADISRKLKEATDEQNKKKKDGATLRELMQQAGIDAPVSRFWIGALIFCVFLRVVLMLFPWPAAAKTLLMFSGLGFAKLFLKIKAARRQKKFLKEFADALDAMGRLLQAGMPMSEAIAMASREFTGPLKEEMIRIYDNQKIGVSIGEAAQMTARRVPLPEVHMFATALQIQSETGSSLSEVLYNLSAVIRARFRLRRKVQALSSEAKSSAAIIGALPFLIMFGLWCVRPKYIGLLFTTHTGHIMLGGCGIWMFIGILIMRQMINFKI